MKREIIIYDERGNMDLSLTVLNILKFHIPKEATDKVPKIVRLINDNVAPHNYVNRKKILSVVADIIKANAKSRIDN